MLAVMLGVTGCGRSEKDVVWQTVEESFFTETAESEVSGDAVTESGQENTVVKNSNRTRIP